jgi:peptide-methionine (S)-S-oxide reductase
MWDHSEAVEVVYEPDVISYEQLLDVFWAGHNPAVRPYSRQYMSAVFYHSEAQREIALAARERESEERREELFTEVLPASEFYEAELFHQKFYLRREEDLLAEFSAMLPAAEDFVASTAATRVNGYLAGRGTAYQLAAEIDIFGLSPDGRERLLELAADRSP